MGAASEGQVPIFFEDAEAFRAWLARHHSTAPELLVGFRKVGSGLPSMTWPESVDEALCFGWIDGVRSRIDETSYQIRFTPRRPGSIWSRVNVAKVERLVADGRMRPAGVAAFEGRSDARTGVYAFERAQPATLDAADRARFQQELVAWQFFESTPPSYRHVVVHWVVSARQPATRERRLMQLIEACAAQRRLRR